MMPETHCPRLFIDEAAIRRIGEGLLDRTLPRVEWTHEAHLAASLWLVRERPSIDLDRELRAIIAGYNESVGGVNDDAQGYHETITRCFLHGVRLHLATMPTDAALLDQVNALLVSRYGRREWPLSFYTRATLFSVVARRDYVQPDIAPLPAIDVT